MQGNVVEGMVQIRKDVVTGTVKDVGKVFKSTTRTLKTAHGMGADVVESTTKLGSSVVAGTAQVARGRGMVADDSQPRRGQEVEPGHPARDAILKEDDDEAASWV